MTEQNNIRRVFVNRDGYTRLGWVAIIGLVAGAVVVSIVGSVVNAVPVRISCERTAEAMDLDEHWGFWTGCLVEHDGELVKLDELRKVR